jgi:hypothetical protein
MANDITDDKELELIAGGEPGVYVALCPQCNRVHFGVEREDLRFDMRWTAEDAAKIRDAITDILKRLAQRERDNVGANLQ